MVVSAELNVLLVGVLQVEQESGDQNCCDPDKHESSSKVRGTRYEHARIRVHSDQAAPKTEDLKVCMSHESVVRRRYSRDSPM